MVAINLSNVKAQAEAAKASPLELEMWRDGIEPDDVLRLVEVARLAREVSRSQSHFAMLDLRQAMKVIEP